MSNLSLYLITFNAGLALIDTTAFSHTLFSGLRTSAPPDLVVLSIQEIAPLAYAFRGGDSLASYFSAYESALCRATDDRFGTQQNVKYERVCALNVGFTAMLLFTRKDWQGSIAWTETAGVGVGLQEMGNKGAVGVRLGLRDGSQEGAVVTFVAAHLRHMEDAVERRNQDWQSICRGMVFERMDECRSSRDERDDTQPLLASSPPRTDSSNPNDMPHTLFHPTSHVFVTGDLNYRTSSRAPNAGDPKGWPQPTTTLEHPHHYQILLAQDQLTRERKANRTLHNLSEAKVDFPPTYKYSSAACEHARAQQSGNKQAMGDDEVWLWAQNHWPSWCDRILYLAALPPKVHAYDALAIQPTSDHRPVALSCTISNQPIDAKALDVESPFTIRSDWREARNAARRLEAIVGMAMYLGCTWEGEAMIVGSAVGVLGGYWALSSLLT